MFELGVHAQACAPRSAGSSDVFMLGVCARPPHQVLAEVACELGVCAWHRTLTSQTFIAKPGCYYLIRGYIPCMHFFRDLKCCLALPFITVWLCQRLHQLSSTQAQGLHLQNCWRRFFGPSKAPCGFPLKTLLPL